MFSGTHVSPALALSEKWQREITPKILMPELWILNMNLDLLTLYPHMKFHFNSISWTWVIEFGQKKYDNWQREITQKILMPELWILCMTLGPLKHYPHMKFHFNSISWTWVIAFGQKKWREKKYDGKKSETYRQTDG